MNNKSQSKAVDFTLKYVGPLLFIFAAISAAYLLKAKQPKARKRPPSADTQLVEVQKANSISEQIKIKAMGIVIPVNYIDLKPQVSGKVVWINPKFHDGALLEREETLIKIEKTDYELELAAKKAQLVSAKYELELEKGRQEVARAEYEMLGGKNLSELEKALTLRIPHLENAKATVKAAEAAVKQAEINLLRTEITVPFNSIVSMKSADLGSHINSQTAICGLTGTDSAWIKATIPVSRLSRIKVPENDRQKGNKVNIKLSGNGKLVFQGELQKLLPELENKGRMAQVLVKVSDPFAIKNDKQEPLLMNSFVKTEIEAGTINNVIKIPRAAVRDFKYVWIAVEKPDKKPDGYQLEIRQINPVWSNSSYVLVRNSVKAGELVVISDIPTPVLGMTLEARLPGENNEQ